MQDGIILFDCSGRLLSVRVPTGSYDTIESLISAVNLSIKSNIRLPDSAVREAFNANTYDMTEWHSTKIKRTGPQNHIGTELSLVNNKVHIKRPLQVRKIWMSPCLRSLLGVGANQWFTDPNEKAAATVPDLSAGLNILYIYSDIVAHRIVSDSYAPLLRAVSVPSETKFNTRVVIEFSNVQYVALDKTDIDTISIVIRDSLGRVVTFPAGEVVLTLHFKKLSILA